MVPTITYRIQQEYDDCPGEWGTVESWLNGENARARLRYLRQLRVAHGLDPTRLRLVKRTEILNDGVISD